MKEKLAAGLGERQVAELVEDDEVSPQPTVSAGQGASPLDRAVAPSAMLKKLAAYERQNQLDLALQEIGRIERTLFMLDWLELPELRRRCWVESGGERARLLTKHPFCQK